jgi:hypothetical protein
MTMPPKKATAGDDEEAAHGGAEVEVPNHVRHGLGEGAGAARGRHCGSAVTADRQKRRHIQRQTDAKLAKNIMSNSALYEF